MNDKEKLDVLLAGDPLSLAEKLTGKDSHHDEGTVGLGMLIAMSVNEKKKELLKKAGDTYYGINVEEFNTILISNGFEKILTVPFVGKGYGGEPDVQEYFCCFWNKEKSILVQFDTFGGNLVNSSTAYFNWLVRKGSESYRYDLPINGGGTGYSQFLGTSIDTREGFIRHLERMEVIGEFLKKWEDNPFLFLLHYMDTKDPAYDYKAINKERISQFPGYVLDAINP